MHAQLMKATMGALLPTQSDIQPPVQEGPLDSATLAEVHQNADAWWSVTLYGQCKPYIYIVTQLRQALIPT